MKMDKIVIIINGNGGVGKDTLCDFASEKYKVKNISAITPIKKIASQYGWKGEKNQKSRKFLADLKSIFIEYNDLPFKYLKEEYEKFLRDHKQILFVHIRESEEIDKFKNCVEIPCVTLLIRREDLVKNWGNASDDNVENYAYDYIYDNNKSIIDAKSDFLEFLQEILFNTLKKRTIIKNEVSNTMFSKYKMAGAISNWYLQNKELLQKRIPDIRGRRAN